VRSERCKKKESIVMKRRTQVALEACFRKKIRRRQPVARMRKK